MRHPGLSQRFALLIVPAPAQRGPRSAVAHADEEAYRKRLREIGFDVLTIGPASRPDLDQALRAAAARIPTGAEVALFVLGTALSGSEDVYLMPSDAPGDVTRAEALDTEGLRLGDVLRRLSGRGPRQLVVIVDECRRVGDAGPDCAVDAAAGGSGASVMASYRNQARSSASGGPLARRGSLGELLNEEIVKEGTRFLQLFETLRARLAGSDLGLVSTSSLSTGFAFVPAGFFAGLPTECNRVDPNADATSLRGLNPEALLRACESAVANWPYAPRFAERLAAAREQRAFKRAVASCEDRVAIAAYASAYPSGRYKRAVDDFAAGCRPQPGPAAPPARAVIASRAGWKFDYASELLFVDPDANDTFDSAKQSYDTVWHSRLHGNDVTIYVQISANQHCRSAERYAREQIARHRKRVDVRVSRSPGASRDGIVVEGRGLVAGNKVLDRATYDFVSVQRSDPSTIVHVGGRFPPEIQDIYRSELQRIIDSLKPPGTDPFTGRCL